MGRVLKFFLDRGPKGFGKKFQMIDFLAAGISISVAALSMSVGSAHGTNYFSWGVESMTPSWGANGAATGVASLRGSTSIDSTVAHSGSKSMKISVTMLGTNESTGIDLNGVPPTYPFKFINSPSLYFRWWMRIMPGFNWGDGSTWGGPSASRTKAGRQSLSDLTAQWYTGAIFSAGFRITECEQTSGHAGGCLTNAGTPGSDQGAIFIPYNVAGKADGLWHEYIVRVKPNSVAACSTPGNCDAEFEAYVDGISVGSYKNFRLSPVDGPFLEWWGSWMTNPYFQGGSSFSAGGTIYLDDYSTDDTWNSTVSPSGPGGVSPPPKPNLGKPKNLRFLI